jgi:hypothetical protein
MTLQMQRCSKKLSGDSIQSNFFFLWHAAAGENAVFAQHAKNFFMLLVTGVFASDGSLSMLPIKDSFVSCQLLHQSQFPSSSTKSEAIGLRHEKREIPKTGEQSWIQIRC